jgi:hypothetical protein
MKKLFLSILFAALIASPAFGSSPGLSDFDEDDVLTNVHINAIINAIDDNYARILAGGGGGEVADYFTATLLEHEHGGLEADVSAYDGIPGISAGSTFEAIQWESNCADNITGICIDSDDWKVYRWTGAAMSEIGVGVIDTDYDGDLTDETPSFDEVTANVFNGITIGDCSDGNNCTADEILNNEDISPAGGTWDLSNLSITFPSGGWYFADEATSPTVTGQFKYKNDCTGIEDGCMVWYDDDEIKYLIDVATLPTTTGQIPIYNASTDKWVPGTVEEAQTTFQKCTTALAVTSDSNWAIERFPYAITITDIYVYQNGATNVIGGLDECTGTNGVCSSVTAVDSDITGTDGAEVQDDGTLTNGGITAGNRVYWHTTSVSGTNEDIQICFDYTID